MKQGINEYKTIGIFSPSLEFNTMKAALGHYEDDVESSSSKPKPTPLPIRQLLIVYLTQFTEPVSASVIYPFVNQFVRDTGVTGGDERKTGYYAGAVVSLCR
jgi:hypothetical protein